MSEPKNAEVDTEVKSVDNALIAELLAVAYSIHVAACESSDLVPQPADRFAEIYKGHIVDFRKATGAARPLNG